MKARAWAVPLENGDRSFLLTCERGRRLLVVELTFSRLCGGDGSCDTLRGKWVELGPRGRRGRVLERLTVAGTKAELERILAPVGGSRRSSAGDIAGPKS